MKTCLIFGNGYICKSFIEQYEKNINFIIVSHELYDINNPNYEYLESYISIYNIDYIIDSICPILPTSMHNQININLLKNTIKHINYINTLVVKLHIKNVIYLSSAGIIYDKTNYCESLQYNHIDTLYGLLKIQSECTYKYFSDINKDINYKILRISNVYGNIKYHKSNENGIINILLKHYIENKQTNITLINSVKNYIYIKDLCYIMYKLLDYKFNNTFEIINIGSIYDYSIQDIITIIQSKYNLDINYNDDIIYNDNQYYIDINKIKNIFTNIKFTSLEYIIKNIDINNI